MISWVDDSLLMSNHHIKMGHNILYDLGEIFIKNIDI